MRTSPYLGIAVGQEQTGEVECLYPMRAYALPLIGILTTPLVWAAESPVDFNREVRPILSDRCYGCHGPDADKGRKAGLRLDEIGGATKKLKSGDIAIVPGDLEKSTMVHRILSTDPEDIMPPPELHRPLSAAEKDILRRWIKQGAKYDPHWAFVSPSSHATPAIADSSWAKDPLDAFIADKAAKVGLKPSRRRRSHHPAPARFISP
jgi:hypothetical protein